MSDRKKSTDFNVYYLNFSKVYEISMMINNVILSSIQKENTKSFEKQYGYASTLSAKGSKMFLEGIKASISSEAKESTFSSSRVVENLDVKTTKSILLRRIIERCNHVRDLIGLSEGDLIKMDNVKMEIFDEESLRQFLILRKDALKGFRVEGMEINNLISSILQDYSYVLRGTYKKRDGNEDNLIIKIPLEIQDEFENKYSINDLLIGHVSIIGLYKEIVEEEFIASNTFTYLQNIGLQQQTKEKVFKSDEVESLSMKTPKAKNFCHFIDIIAIVQDVKFYLPSIKKKSCWLLKLFRRNHKPFEVES